jgi:hypothetical protein
MTLTAPHPTATRPTPRPAMQQQYRNMEQGLGVVAFAIGDDHITITLHTGQSLRFTCRSAGRAYVEHMKLLARAGDGLTRFIYNEAKGKHEPVVAP